MDRTTYVPKPSPSQTFLFVGYALSRVSREIDDKNFAFLNIGAGEERLSAAIFTLSACIIAES